MSQISVKTSIIVARSRNGIIGRGDEIPWQGKLAADMEYFRDVTYGFPVLMGRKTYESLDPRFAPLPGRLNIILSRNGSYDPRPHSKRDNYDPEQVTVVTSYKDALLLCVERGMPTLVNMGGGELYHLGLEHPSTTKVYVTEIDEDFEGDVSFPDLDPEIWRLFKSWGHKPFYKNHLSFRWDVYERAS